MIKILLNRRKHTVNFWPMVMSLALFSCKAKWTKLSFDLMMALDETRMNVWTTCNSNHYNSWDISHNCTQNQKCQLHSVKEKFRGSSRLKNFFCGDQVCPKCGANPCRILCWLSFFFFFAVPSAAQLSCLKMKGPFTLCDVRKNIVTEIRYRWLWRLKQLTM